VPLFLKPINVFFIGFVLAPQNHTKPAPQKKIENKGYIISIPKL
jgi:hypothetical protein